MIIPVKFLLILKSCFRSPVLGLKGLLKSRSKKEKVVEIRSRNLPKMGLLFAWSKKKKRRVAEIRSRNLPKMGLQFPWSKKKKRRESRR